MICKQVGCTVEATYIVFWPGQETCQCDEHTKLLKALANVMGFELSIAAIVEKLDHPLE